MSASSHLEFLERAIRGQRGAIRLQIGFAVGCFLAGLIIVWAVYHFLGSTIPDSLKSIVTLGGGLLSTSSAFPLKDLLNRKEKVTALLFLRTEFGDLKNAPQIKDPNEMERLEQQFWQLISKILGG
jgi:hypothetical protein